MITDLIAKGKAKIAEEERQLNEKERERQKDILVESAAQEMELDEILRNTFPADVLEFVGRVTELPVNGGNDVYYRIEAPECIAVSFKINRGWVKRDNGDDNDYGYHFTGLSKFSPGEYSEDRERYWFMVDVQGVMLNEERGYVIVSHANKYGSNDLEQALAYANFQHARIAELRAEADLKNQKRAEKQEQELAAKLEQELAAKLEQDIEQAEADEQLAEMMRDPIMGPLLKMVNAIMQERADSNQRIADMNEAMESSEYYYSEAMSRLEKRVSEEERRRSDAEREAENAHYETREAEDKLRRATKKTDVWG